MKNTKKILALLLAFVMVLGLAACGGEKEPEGEKKDSKYGGIYRVVTTAKCAGLLPIKSTVAAQFSDPVYEGLIWIDNIDNHIEKILATDYKLSEDGKVVTVDLRKGVKFHDGTDFNADAVVWSYAKGLENKQLSRVHNPKVEKVNDYQVKIIFDNAYVDYESAMVFKICSPSWYEKVGEEKNLYEPCGTGPFKFKEIVQDKSVTYVRFEDYWRKDADGNQLPYLDAFEILSINDDNAMMTALVNGDGDAMKMGTGSIIKQLKAQGFTDKRVMGADALILYGIAAYDGGKEDNPWHKKEVREAIFKYGLDYKTIQQLGEPDLGIIDHNMGAEQSLCYDKSITSAYEYNAAKCKEMLAAAGYPDGFETDIYCISIATDIATAVQTALKEYNIKVNVNEVGSGDQRRKDGVTPGLFFLTLPSAYDNVANTIGSTFDPNGTGYNKNMIFSDEFIKLRQDALNTITYADRAPKGVAAIKQLLLEDYTCTILCHVPTPIFESMDVHDSHAGNFQFTPATIWREVKTQKLN